MTIKAYMNDGTVDEYPNAYIYWEWDESGSDTKRGSRKMIWEKMRRLVA